MGFYGMREYLNYYPELMRDHVKKWVIRCYDKVGGNVGWVDTQVRHLWHGSLVDRRYSSRTDIVNQFRPEQHLYWNNDRLLEWSGSAPERLKGEVASYFGERNEDAASG